MKSEETSRTIPLETYTNEKATRLKADVKALCLSEAKHLGKRDAEDQVPKLKGESLKRLIASPLSMIQGLIYDLYQMHGSQQSIRLTNEKIQERLHTARNERDEVALKLDSEKSEYDRMQSQMPSRLAYYITLAVVGACMIDGFILRPVLHAMVHDYFLSWMLSLALGVALGFVAHRTADALSKSRTRLRKVLIWTGITLVFLALNVVRSYYNSLATIRLGEAAPSGGLLENIDVLETFAFTLMSLAFYSTSVWLSRMTPKLSDWIAIFKSKQQGRLCKKLSKALSELENEISKSTADLHDLKQFSYSRLRVAAADEREVMGYVELVRSAYVQANRRHRYSASDDVPDCYDQNLDYELETYYQDLSKIEQL